MYKKSRYNLIQKLDDGCGILYNTKSGSIIEVQNEEYVSVQKILEDVNNNVTSDTFRVLLEEGFIVKKDKDELQEVKDKYLNNFNSNNHLNLVLLPAEYCNFTCEYCFIYKYGGTSMDESIYSSIKKYIKKRYLKDRSTSTPYYVNIGWYGGEPLLKKQDIITFMRSLKSEFSEFNIRFTSSIITNGYYLDKETFEQLLDVGIDTFQVTFDGPKEYHNLTRRTRDGRGSYDILIKNLKDILKNLGSNQEFEFSLRINFLRTYKNEVYGLINELVDIVGGDERFFIYCRPVYNFETTREDIKEIECDIYNTEEGLTYQKDFTDYISKKRNSKKVIRMINDFLPLPTTSWCSEDNKYSAIIGANRKVYYCDTLVGDDSVSVGELTFDGDIQYNEIGEEWMKPIFDYENIEDCEKCRLLPVCMGSCKRNRVEGNSTPCLFDESFIKNLIKEYYLSQ